MDIMKIANSIPMWIACGIPVMLVVLQAVVFGKNAYGAGKKMGLTDKQLKGAVKSSAITSIGPSVVILSGMLSLLITVGGPMAWMRLSLIGSVMFESVAAGIGTQAVGVTLGTDAMTDTAFGMAVWTMILGSIGWVLFATFSADKMEKIQTKLSGGNAAMMTTIASAAIIAVFSAFSANNLVRMDKASVACVIGGVFMGVLMTIAEKKKVKWLNEWALTISILGGMIITALI